MRGFWDEGKWRRKIWHGLHGLHGFLIGGFLRLGILELFGILIILAVVLV
jgi:hypothetical protein